MIIGAVSGGSVGLLAIITVVYLFYCCCWKSERRKSHTMPPPTNSRTPLTDMQSTASSVELKNSTKTQRGISDTDSLAEENTKAEAAIIDKPVSTLYYCGNWQAPHNTDTKSVCLSVEIIIPMFQNFQIGAILKNP